MVFGAINPPHYCAKGGCGKPASAHIGYMLGHVYEEPPREFTAEDRGNLNDYVQRTAREFAAKLPDRTIRENIERAARLLVIKVMNDMAIHLSHPQTEETQSEPRSDTDV